jgi:hypothetical protein
MATSIRVAKWNIIVIRERTRSKEKEPTLMSVNVVAAVGPDGGRNRSGEAVWQTARGDRLRKVYLWVVFSLLILGGITFALSSFHKVFYPFGWDDDEGAVWWGIAHVTSLGTFYHPIQQYPYIVNPYPPLFHSVARMAGWITGNDLVAGRLVCVLSALGTSVIIGLLVFHVSPERIPKRIRASGALLATLLCFRLDSLSNYIPEMGVDLFAVLLTFVGVYLFIRYTAKPAFQYAAFVLFVLGVFTKQTMIAAPLACLIATAIVNPKKAVRLLSFSAALSLAILGYLCWATGGEVLRHIFLYNAKQPFSITHLMLGMQENVIRMLPIAAIACLAFLPFLKHSMSAKPGSFLRWLRRGIQSSPFRRALAILGLQLVFALVSSTTYGKLGSGYHYFLEWNFACCPLCGLLFVRALAWWRPSSRYTLGAAAVFLLLMVTALTGFPDSLRRVNSMFRLTSGERRIQDVRDSSAAAALRIVEETPGPVLCENMVVAMKAHKEIPIEPGILCFFARRGVWDQSDFVKMISSQRFGVIILRSTDNGFWTDEIIGAIEKHYVLAESLGNPSVVGGYYVVYRPRGKVGGPLGKPQ